MEYKKVKLEEICKVNQGLQIPISKRFKENGKNRYFYITIQFLKGNTEDYYIENPKPSVICNKDDILVVRTGNTGMVLTNVEGCFHNNFFKVVPNENVYPKYLYYALNNKDMYKKMLNAASGTTIPDLKHSDFYQLEICLPNMNEQKKIVNILSSIDEKIELNNKINNNLYVIGNELLKNDFTLESGRETLSQVIKFVKGKKPFNISNNKQVGYEKYLTIACLNGQELNYADTNKMIMSDNDLLMVMDGASSGEVYYGGQGIVGSTLSRIDCIDNNYISEFIFFCLKYYKDLIQSKNTGSAIPHTDKVFVGSLEIPKLDIEKQERYKVLLSKIQHNKNENKILEQLRDTLLPKLVNGEIDLDNIEI